MDEKYDNKNGNCVHLIPLLIGNHTELPNTTIMPAHEEKEVTV